MKRLVATLASSALLLSGCNMMDDHAKWFPWTAPDHGKVTDRHFEPAHMTSGSSSCDSKGVCTYIPGTYIPDTWSLDLFDESSGDHGWQEVERYAYDTCKIGQQYPNCAR